MCLVLDTHPERRSCVSDQRKPFLDLLSGSHYQVHSVVLNLDPKICVERVARRVNHEGNVEGPGGTRIVHMNKNVLAKSGPPSLGEGFHSVWICNTPGDVEHALDYWQKVMKITAR